VIYTGGRQAIQQYARQAESLGLILRKDLTEGAEAAKDQLEIIADVVKVNFTEGLLEEFVTDFDDFAKLAKDPSVADGMRGLGQLVGDLARVAMDVAIGTGIIYSNIQKLRETANAHPQPTILPGGEILQRKVKQEEFGPEVPALGDTISQIKKRYAEEQRLLKKGTVFVGDSAAADKARKDADRDLKQINDTVKALQHRNDQLGRSSEEMELYNQLRAAGTDLDTQAGQQIQVLVHDYMKLSDETERMTQAAEGIGQAFGSAFESAALEAESFGDVVSALGKDIERALFRSFVSQPLSDAVTKFASDILPNFFGSPSHDYVGRYEGGKSYSVGVPEVFIPSGSGGMAYPLDKLGGGSGIKVSVINNNASQNKVSVRGAGGNGDSLQIIIDQAVAQNINSPGSQTNRALREFGSSPITGQ
jgi:hypothetical protein